MKILAKQFQKLDLHRRYHLNFGGCGFFALTVYDKFKPIMPQLRLVNIKDDFGHGYYHVVLEHRGLRFDSEGLALKWAKYSSEFVSYKQLLFDINARDTWNDKFNRKHVPEIEEQIYNIFHRFQHQIVHELSQPKKLILPSGRSLPLYEFVRQTHPHSQTHQETTPAHRRSRLVQPTTIPD